LHPQPAYRPTPQIWWLAPFYLFVFAFKNLKETELQNKKHAVL
jgi:hypothetical protein